MDSYRKVEVSEFTLLGEDPIQVKNTLQEYANAGVEFHYNDMSVDALLLYTFCDYLIDLNRKKMKMCQRKGIERALLNKSKGIGQYGRPRTSLPHDFDEQIRKRLNNKESLSHYCDKIGMKKSTFYKYANRIKRATAVDILNESKQD
ncbi:MAG: recombinase family protein [Beduini sp.]|uniref:recombinase family protein n=1 Tax=Beduini sp. TaxID=1922300 RepID=UPI0011C7FEDC